MMRQWIQGILLLLFLGFNVNSQETLLTVKGIVVDSKSELAIPYATIVVLSDSSESIITGISTIDDGSFSIQLDTTKSFLEVRFLGYVSQQLKFFPSTDLGKILLESEVQDIDEVKVTAEKSTMEFKLDRRVFHVGKDISSTGAGALEVLNNVPSVTVDIEGNISIRGNAGVQILIDGKPSVFSDDPAKALGSLTADMIESVEVITNPSAKYDAGGTSGIINIILKKQEKKGLNGSISLNTGIPDNHSIGGSINYRTEKFNFFTQFGGGYRSYPRYQDAINENHTDSSIVKSNGVNYRNEQFYNITLGTDYYINKYNTLTLSGNFAYEIESQPSETNFLIYEKGVLVSDYSRIEETTAENPKYQYDLKYEKKFKNNKKHVLQMSALGKFFGKDQRSLFTNRINSGSDNSFDQRTQTYFFQSDYTFQLDYINPFSDNWMLETGSMYQVNDVGNDYAVFDLDSNSNWSTNDNLTNNFIYNQKVLGIYGTGSYEGEKWGVKIGLRTENTDLQTKLVTTNEENNLNYTNFFPTLHTSYKFTKKFSMQIGYSRRIYRPRLWDLNPFFNVRNNYNIYTGNPHLQPEFADSYELTAIWYLGKVSLNGSLYHLYTTDVIESVSIFENNVNISTKQNVGTNNKTGLELNGKYSPTKWLTITGDFNYGMFQRRGVFQSSNFDFNGQQWQSKMMLKFKLPASIDFEVNPQYQSGYKTVQGVSSGFAFVDLGIRKKIWKGKMVLNLGVRDLFASRIRETVIDKETFYLYSFSKRGRFITFGVSYSFGKGEAMSYNGGRRH